MAAYYPSKQNCEKGKSDSLETLPNELILKIFTYLTIKDLGRCAQVSKNFYIIAYDKTLWTKILVTSRMPPNSFNLPLRHRSSCVMPHRLLVQALTRGARHLALSNLNFISTSQPNFPTTNQVEYLALSGFIMDENYFRQLILSFHQLKKLSVANSYGAWKFEDLMKGILQNSNSLKVLDLSGFCKLDTQDIKSILSSCPNLTEANFGYNWWDGMGPVPNLSIIFANSTPNIKKLGLSGTAINVDAITQSCHNLKHLDLTCARFIDEPEHRNIKFPTKIQLESLYMRGFDLEFTYLEMLILSCENSLQVLDISYCKKMTPQAIQLIVSRCLYLTAVNFCGLKHTAFICKNLTPTIENVSLSHTDISNEDIKMMVSRCNKIKVLNISHTKVVINDAVDDIILHLSSTLEKLSLSTYFSPPSQFDCSPLFKLGYMPKLKYLWSTGMERIMDLWKKQFPTVVLACNSHFSCYSQCYCYPIITPNPFYPNIAKTMSEEETIWEIQCEGIEISGLEVDDPKENKTNS